MDLNTELTGYFSRYCHQEISKCLRNHSDIFQPDGQCEHPRPFRLPLNLFLRVRALLQRVPVRDLPQGGREERPPPPRLRHRLQRHQEDPRVHQQQHDQLYCLNKSFEFLIKMSSLLQNIFIADIFLVKCF